MTTLRIGHGYDVHRLVEGRRLILGGVDIPWEKGLLGHSDADVLVHAIMDALTGAARLGDIGRLFRQSPTPYRRMLYLLILSCVPLLLVLPLQDFLTSVSADNDILVEGICFLITSTLLFLADRAPRGRLEASTMKGKHALAIGAAQLFATLPGISRSGSTISVGQMCGLERSYAVSYSFILGLPAVLAAGILDLHDAAAGGVVSSNDIRAGISLVIAALSAKGETVISNAETIDRGYESIERTLTNLGADIRRV